MARFRQPFERENLRWKAYEQAVKKVKVLEYRLAETELAMSELVACSNEG